MILEVGLSHQHLSCQCRAESPCQTDQGEFHSPTGEGGGGGGERRGGEGGEGGERERERERERAQRGKKDEQRLTTITTYVFHSP